jgi:autoinducer 2-degrading protein
MSRLAIIVTIEVAPGRRDQLLPLLMAHRARCLKDEHGITLEFEVLVPYEDDTKVLSYEVYRDDAAFEVHRNGPSTGQFREETAGMIVKLHATKCAVPEGQPL